MTQVEVPQISLQRYFDLLKRRRWQVIPVSLLGLLVGGMVALFIPRYYVADTLLVHQKVAGPVDPDHPEDPFRSIVDSAKLSMPLAIGETMEALKWPEAMVRDPSQRTQNEKAVEARLRINDANAGIKDRDWAQIRVSYSDRDAQRAASFLNTLVDTWIQKRLRELRDPATAELNRAKQAVEVLRSLHLTLSEERKQLAIQYQIDPNRQGLLQLTRIQAQERLETELRNKVETVERELEGKRSLLEAAREQLENTAPRVEPDARLLLEKLRESPDGEKVFLRLQHFEAKLKAFRSGTEDHEIAVRGIAEAKLELQQLVGAGDADADGLVPNPAFVALKAAVVAGDAEVSALQAQFATLQGQLRAEARRVEERALGFDLYERKSAQWEQAGSDLDEANDALRKANATIAALGMTQTITQVGTAQPPPRPTDPNILVVALLGCVLGLGAAIALILLLDLVQGTFKTLDDVERALPVPVLGGMSHLETEAEREESLRRRRRMSLASAAFLTLVVVVVTIFYVDPTRLPPVVRDLLAMLLGS